MANTLMPNEIAESLENHLLHLPKNHSYYAQVQGEMAIMNLEWCDFVVHNNGEVYAYHIVVDFDYWTEPNEVQYLTIMADEMTDCSNKEQFVDCFRWVNSDFEIHEEFVGLRDVKRTDAETLSIELKDVLVRLNLSPHKMRGQCYYGASCMAGMKYGVAARLSRDESRAVYTHCYGHALSLACSDAIKQCKVMKESLETTHEITKLITTP